MHMYISLDNVNAYMHYISPEESLKYTKRERIAANVIAHGSSCIMKTVRYALSLPESMITVRKKKMTFFPDSMSVNSRMHTRVYLRRAVC